MRLLCTTIAILALAAASAGATAAPRIALSDRTPLTVVGAGFGADKVVHVTISYGSVRLAKRVDSTASGRFVARFQRSLPATSCTQLTIVAATARTRLTKKILPAADGCGTERVTP